MDYKGININLEVVSKYDDENLKGWLKDNGLDESELTAFKKALAAAKKKD
jgi:hypothetical protein